MHNNPRLKETTMPLVTTDGFRPILPLDTTTLGENVNERSIRIAGDAQVEALRDKFAGLDLIKIEFGSFADGRGFSLTKRLRNLGYKGHLRASGHVISDQFRYALDCGFNDVEISDELAKRQPEADWISDRATSVSSLDRLRGRGSSDLLDERREVASPPETGPQHEEYVPQTSVFEQRVTHVKHYTDGLFGFRITRPASFRFRSGEFVMIGLPNAKKPVFRAYSIASPSWDDTLEFYSIKVPGGPLTEHLQHVSVGDTVLVRKKATGTLVIDALTPAKRLYLLATGTGVAPFASLIRDPETYEKFEQIVLTHTCRYGDELTYGHEVVNRANSDPLVGELAQRQLVFYPTSTRASGPRTGRITNHIETGELFRELDLPPLHAGDDRAMICGSLPMVHDTKSLLETVGLQEGANSRPGDFVVERAFVD
jgi:ferredoxin--NADP+ reductase